jgi:hypothetical protein
MTPRFQRDPQFVMRKVGPKRVLVPTRTPMPTDVLMFLLDGPVAERIWELLAAPTSPRELADAIATEFEAADPAPIESEVVAYLEQLLALGGIRDLSDDPDSSDPA